MRPSNSYKPKVIKYAPNDEGVWTSQPEPDDYCTLITKWYQENGTIVPSTWYYPGNKLHRFRVSDGILFLSKHEITEGRDQRSYIPLSEIIRFDYNPPSKAYHSAMEGWVKQEFGMDYSDWLEQNQAGQGIELQENLRSDIAKRLGLPPNAIDIEFGSDPEE